MPSRSPTLELTLLGGAIQFALQDIETPIALVTLTFDTFTVTARGEDMAYTLPVNKQVKVQVAYVDSHGNPATVDGAVTWGSSDETIARVDAETEPVEATFEALIVPVGKTGQVQIVARCDADLGSGVRELNTLMDVTVIAGEAVAGTITPAGEPADIPHVEPQR